MPITKIETKDIPSLYVIGLEGNVTYDYHIASFQQHLEAARAIKVRSLALDFRQTIYVDPRLLSLLRYFRWSSERTPRIYYLGDKYKIDGFFRTVLYWQTRGRLAIRPDLETLVKELTAKQ